MAKSTVKKPVYRVRPVAKTDKLVVRVNVDAQGFSTKDLTSAAMKNSILFLLKQGGWGVYVLSVKKARPEDQYFYISVVINAAANTNAELEKIKNGVGNVLSTVLPLSSLEASFAGKQPAQQPASVNKNVSAFTFQEIGIGSNLRDRHARFNQLFVGAFPRLLYTNPSTSYNEPVGLGSIGGASQIHALGETALSPDATKARVISLLQQANIPTSSQINFDQYTIEQIQQGAKLTPPKNTTFVNKPKGGAGNDDRKSAEDFSSYEDYLKYLKIPPLPGENFLETLGKALGLDTLAKSLGLIAGTATVTALVVGGVFLVVMLKK
ncbi:MAG: hypothetical protein ACR2MG_20875 [Pyrinomonadaceae bacterium]